MFGSAIIELVNKEPYKPAWPLIVEPSDQFDGDRHGGKRSFQQNQYRNYSVQKLFCRGNVNLSG